MTDVSSIPQIVTPDTGATTTPTPRPVPPARPAPPPSQSLSSSEPATGTGAVSQTGASAGIPYQLQYDADTHRFILEARDPKTGAVIAEVPRQSAFQQIQATAAATSPAPPAHSVDESA